MKPRIIVFLFVAVATFTSCHRAEAPDDAPAGRVVDGRVVFPANSPQAAALVASPATVATAGSVRLTGRLVWNEDATVRVFSTFEGRVARILAPVGAPVEKDAPLALVASADYGQVQADAAKAVLDRNLAEQTFARLKELSANGAAAEKDLRAAEIDLARVQAEARRTAQRLQLYGGAAGGADQEFALRSPLAGVVVEKNINPGQSVRPDQITASAPPLFVITNPARLWVLLDATEQDLASLKIGAVVALHTPTYPDDAFAAQVEAIADTIDPATRTIKVRAAVENAARRLKAEMFVTAEIATAPPAGVEVAAAAVFLKGDRHYVFVEEVPGAYRRREVKVGAGHGGRIVVTEGLAVGERVVSDGAVILDQIMSENGSS